MTFDAPHRVVQRRRGAARGAEARRLHRRLRRQDARSTARSREICTKAARRFEELGCIVEEASPDLGAVDEAFLALRSQHFVVDRELQLQTHRDKLKPDIIWNTERGLKQTPSALAWAERERAAFYRRMVDVLRRPTTCW